MTPFHGIRAVQSLILAVALPLALTATSCHDKASAGGDAATNLDAAHLDGSAHPDAAEHDAGPASDAEVTTDADVQPDASTCTPMYTDLSLTLDSSGGWVGTGFRDYQLSGMSFTVTTPGNPPDVCTGTLTSAEHDALLAAAELVQWATLAVDYYPPENPYCCCDQYLYDFSINLTACLGGAVSATTAWCDESLTSNLLPQALRDFVNLLDQYAAQIVAGC